MIFFILDLNLLIEYDGEFHYFNNINESQLVEQQRHDLIKTNYAKNNKFNLLRIPY